jgi:ADP-dependent NAD(P)H-hydrate dehydratase / NAD(P)H-hydrate epimerase
MSVAITAADVAKALPPRLRDAHKGLFGSVLIVGSSCGMPGAALLAGRAALRSGAGRVSLLTANPGRGVAYCPELMHVLVDDPAELAQAIAQAQVCAIGPGLGQSAWAQSCFEMARARDRPTVFDADALNLLADEHNPRPLHPDTILTPHPGEAARLLRSTPSQIQADRAAALAALLKRFQCVVVLKGAGTLVVAPQQEVRQCMQGNPGMASAGMGDVLTGVIAAFLAQGVFAHHAAYSAVWAHANAGDRAAARCGERGLLASDLVEELPRAVNF